MSKIVNLLAAVGICIGLYTNCCEASKVAVVLDAPLFYVHDSKSRVQLEEKVKMMFPEEKFEVIPLDSSVNAVQIYREEAGLAALVTNANGGEVSYEWRLEKSDLDKLNQILKCDYILNMYIIGNRKDVANILQSGIKASAFIDAKLYDCAKKDIIMVSKIAVEAEKMDSITTFLPFSFGKVTYKKSFAKAMKAGLEKLALDTKSL